MPHPKTTISRSFALWIDLEQQTTFGRAMVRRHLKQVNTWLIKLRELINKHKLLAQHLESPLTWIQPPSFMHSHWVSSIPNEFKAMAMTIHRDRSRSKSGLAKQASTINRHFSMSKRELTRNKNSYCFHTWFLGRTLSSISLESRVSRTEWMKSTTLHWGTWACRALWSTKLTCQSMLQLLKPCSVMKSQTHTIKTSNHRLNCLLTSWKFS